MHHRIGYALSAVAVASAVAGTGIVEGALPASAVIAGATAAVVALGALWFFDPARHVAPADGPPKAGEFDVVLGLTIVTMFLFLVLSFYFGSLVRPSAYDVSGLRPSGMRVFDAGRFLGIDGMTGTVIESEILRFLDALPRDEAWRHRATVGLGAALTSFALLWIMIRMFARWGIIPATALAALCGLGAHGWSQAFTFRPSPPIPCERYVELLSGGETLATTDINFLAARGCVLPPGFEMDRVRRSAPRP